MYHPIWGYWLRSWFFDINDECVCTLTGDQDSVWAIFSESSACSSPTLPVVTNAIRNAVFQDRYFSDADISHS